MATHNDFGREAENLACRFLEEQQYQILHRNYRYQKAEVDIIASKGEFIVFVEVKARATNVFIQPEEAVNRKKIKLIISAANHYLEENNVQKEVRFDIISIINDKQITPEIHHLIDAFQSFD